MNNTLYKLYIVIPAEAGIHAANFFHYSITPTIHSFLSFSPLPKGVAEGGGLFPSIQHSINPLLQPSFPIPPYQRGSPKAVGCFHQSIPPTIHSSITPFLHHSIIPLPLFRILQIHNLYLLRVTNIS